MSAHGAVGAAGRRLARGFGSVAIGIASVAACALACGAHAATSRRDVPWIVVVRAVPSASAGASAACPPALAPFIERGARCAVQGAAGGALVVAEGPPELEAEITAAMSGGAGRVFAEGRLADGARAPGENAGKPGASPGARGAGANRGAAPGGGGPTPAPAPGRAVLPLAPTASLWDVEGNALVLLVQRALPQLKPGDVALGFAPGRAWLEVNAPVDQVIAALTPLADKQLGPSALAQLELAARAAVAERRARVGVWSMDAARAWLVCGDACVPATGIGASAPGADLGARLRARLIVAAVRSS